MADIATYEVTLTHPDLEGPLVAECIGTTPERAAMRVRMAAFHEYRHAPLMHAECTVVKLHDGPPRDRN